MPPNDTIRPIGHSAPFAYVEPLSMRYQPAMAAALCFALGILLDHTLSQWQIPVVRCIAVALLIGIGACSLQSTLRVQRVALFSVLVLLGWACSGMEMHPPIHTAMDAYADGLSRDIVGSVANFHPVAAPVAESLSLDDPHAEIQDTPAERTYWIVDIDVMQVEDVTPDTSRMVPITGRVRLLWNGDATPRLDCGGLIRLPVRLHVPNAFHDPGVWQYAQYLSDQQIRLRADTREKQIISTRGDHTLSCRFQRLQQWMAQRIPLAMQTPDLHHLPITLRLTGEDEGILNAILLGDRSGLHKRLRVQFERTGTFHLLVVAGLHVSIIAGLLLWLFRCLRCSRTTSTLLSIPLLILYALLTGFGTPVQRALFMTIVFLLARLLSRRQHSLNALGVALLAMLFLKPSSLFEAGPQMTALAVIAIGSIGYPLASRSFLPYLHATQRIHLLSLDPHLPPRLAQFRVMLRMLGESLAPPRHARFATTCLACSVRLFLSIVATIWIAAVSEILMALPMMYYFHRITAMALPANVLCVVLVVPLMACAGLLLIAAMAHPSAALIPAAATAWLLHLTRRIVSTIGATSIADLRVPTPTW